MSRWQRGQNDVTQLITDGKVQRLRGLERSVETLLARAEQLVSSARNLVGFDPVTSYVVAYDGARHAGAAILAIQGLRATAKGGHVAIENVLDAQFGAPFERFRGLRRRRHELDYPIGAEDFSSTAEAERAITTSSTIVENAKAIIAAGQLGPF